MTRVLFAAVLALALVPGARAQRVVVSGEIRHRTELDDRDFAQPADGSVYHLLRTRLAVDARPAPRVRAFVQVQDARLWGGEDPALGLGTLDGDADQLDMHQAFADLDSLGGVPLALRVGRQELIYGNERLVGASNWGNVGRAFDAARLRWTRGTIVADVVAAQLVADAGATAPQTLVGAFGRIAATPDLAVEVFAFGDTDVTAVDAGPDAGRRRRERATAGTRVVGTLGPVGIDAELIGQAGRAAGASGAPRADVRAWLGSAEANVPAGPVRLALGATRLSGDGDAADGVDRHFDTLFGTNHKFYGSMDYFPRLAGAAGLDDLYLSAAGALGTRWTLRVAAHAFSAAADRGDGRALGQELDLTARVVASPAVGLEAGASAFRPAGRVSGRDLTAWAYLMATVRF